MARESELPPLLFARARVLRTADEIHAAVLEEIEDMLIRAPDGTWRFKPEHLFSHILDETNSVLRDVAMHYLHGKSQRTEGAVLVELEVGPGAGEHGLRKQQHVVVGRARRKVPQLVVMFRHGKHLVDTRRATWALWNYGGGIARNEGTPDAIRTCVTELPYAPQPEEKAPPVRERKAA